MRFYNILIIHTSAENRFTSILSFSFRVCLSFCLIMFIVALLFGGKMQVNPAHPKQIGSIDPYCRVTDVVKGRSFRGYCTMPMGYVTCIWD